MVDVLHHLSTSNCCIHSPWTILWTTDQKNIIHMHIHKYASVQVKVSKDCGRTWECNQSCSTAQTIEKVMPNEALHCVALEDTYATPSEWVVSLVWVHVPTLVSPHASTQPVAPSRKHLRHPKLWCTACGLMRRSEAFWLKQMKMWLQSFALWLPNLCILALQYDNAESTDRLWNANHTPTWCPPHSAVAHLCHQSALLQSHSCHRASGSRSKLLIKLFELSLADIRRSLSFWLTPNVLILRIWKAIIFIIVIKETKLIIVGDLSIVDLIDCGLMFGCFQLRHWDGIIIHSLGFGSLTWKWRLCLVLHRNWRNVNILISLQLQLEV